MEKDDIHLLDFKRIFIGNAPPEFLLEVFLRTLIVYFFLMVVVRLLGKRLSGKITITEMALAITLGAIVGSPMQIPDRGILTGVFILLLALTFQKLMNTLSFQRPWLERLTQGAVSCLVADGVLDNHQMRQERVSRTQLFAALRDSQVSQLGQVERVYLESNGTFSVLLNAIRQPGLSVHPQEDPVSVDKPSDRWVCNHCGTTTGYVTGECPRCKRSDWVTAMV